jgi:4-hydroxythreonine-4-phosphate dehydrogenase
MPKEKPIIAVIMGDPSGIGPELTAKVLQEKQVYEKCRPFLIADPKVMSTAAEVVGAQMDIKEIQSVSEAGFRYKEWEVLKPEGVDVPRIEWGVLSAEMGRITALCLKEAYSLVETGDVHGIVSAPLNKEALNKAGYKYSDELEYLKDITDTPDAFILGLAGSFWTTPVTEHVPFRSIPDLITKESVLTRIHRMHKFLKKVGHADPRIGVAALNVHGGEGGLFGQEEIKEIQPAIEEARSDGIDASGPVPADAVFVLAADGNFDGIVAMYHDQANIARKLHARRSGATIFMGLPAPYGTTAHGTAFDIAGKGLAEHGSMMDALNYIVQLTTGS